MPPVGASSLLSRSVARKGTKAARVYALNALALAALAQRGRLASHVSSSVSFGYLERRFDLVLYVTRRP